MQWFGPWEDQSPYQLFRLYVDNSRLLFPVLYSKDSRELDPVCPNIDAWSPWRSVVVIKPWTILIPILGARLYLWELSRLYKLSCPMTFSILLSPPFFTLSKVYSLSQFKLRPVPRTRYQKAMQAPVMSLSPDDSDPLSLQPPLFETLDERTARLAFEQRARDISDRIDEEIERASAAERRGPKPIKILLLGALTRYCSTQLRADVSHHIA